MNFTHLIPSISGAVKDTRGNIYVYTYTFAASGSDPTAIAELNASATAIYQEELGAIGITPVGIMVGELSSTVRGGVIAVVSHTDADKFMKHWQSKGGEKTLFVDRAIKSAREIKQISDKPRQ